MLKSDELDVAKFEVMKHCRQMMLPFVTLYADLPPVEFEKAAKAYVERSLNKLMIRTKGELDQLDHLFIESYWPAIMDEYERLRTAGGSQSGSA